MSISTENFIKTIYKFDQNPGFDTKSGTIAKALNITNAAATDMARKLSNKNLIDYKKYQQLKLTREGTKLALNVIRKHRLWETFLFKVLGLSLHEIHCEAELLEHQTSDFLAEKLSTFLGNPDIDPHGDPIPNVDGEISQNSENILLNNTASGESYEVTRLIKSDKEFFDFCNSNTIIVGSLLSVESQLKMNKITEIVINNTKILLPEVFSKFIYVKPIS